MSFFSIFSLLIISLSDNLLMLLPKSLTLVKKFLALLSNYEKYSKYLSLLSGKLVITFEISDNFSLPILTCTEIF